MAKARNPIVGALQALTGKKKQPAPAKKSSPGMAQKAKQAIKSRTNKIDEAVKKSGG